ncbi:hypothetical protein NFI96_003912, partial [Prochilodus magdalenae]
MNLHFLSEPFSGTNQARALRRSTQAVLKAFCSSGRVTQDQTPARGSSARVWTSMTASEIISVEGTARSAADALCAPDRRSGNVTNLPLHATFHHAAEPEGGQCSGSSVNHYCFNSRATLKDQPRHHSGRSTEIGTPLENRGTYLAQKLREKDMNGFLENLLKSALDFPDDEQLRIERAHRALVPKPTGSQGKPRSIVAKFSSHRTKEDVLRKAWQKKEVLYNNVRFYVDHDYPPAVLKKRSEYSEAKKVLKEKKIKFQTPYPARLRVLYEDGTRLYQSAAAATKDLALRGFPVSVVKPPTDSVQEE